MVNTQAQITAWKECRKSDLTVNGTSEHLNHVIGLLWVLDALGRSNVKTSLPIRFVRGGRKANRGHFLLSLPLALYGLDKI